MSHRTIVKIFLYQYQRVFIILILLTVHTRVVEWQQPRRLIQRVRVPIQSCTYEFWNIKKICTECQSPQTVKENTVETRLVSSAHMTTSFLQGMVSAGQAYPRHYSFQYMGMREQLPLTALNAKACLFTYCSYLSLHGSQLHTSLR